MIYIQKRDNEGIPHHFDCACAMYGAIDLGLDYTLVSFEEVKNGKSSSKLYNLLKDKNLELLDINKLETCKASELAEKEDYWINKLNTKYPYGLNKNKGGSGLNLKYIIK